jgi:surface protein
MKQAYKLLTLLLFFFVCVSNGNAQTLSKGSGTETDPYLIESESDWNTFASDVNGGYDYSGKYLKLTENISVTTMVGTSSHPYNSDNIKPFAGTFDGGGETIAIDIRDVEDAYIAPFRFLNGATIKNIKVTGTVDAATYKQAASLVGRTTGTVNISNCHCSATIQGGAIDNGYGFHGGIVGEANGKIIFTNCVFDGEINAPEVHSCGGLLGWVTNTGTTFNNCLMAGTINCGTTNTGTFYCYQSNTATITNCYYLTAYGTAQGTQVYQTPPEDFLATKLTLADGNDYYLKGETTITDINIDENNQITYTVKFNDETLTENTDYTATVTSNADMCAFLITGQGDYYGSVAMTITKTPYAFLEDDGKTLTFKIDYKPDEAYDIDKWTTKEINNKNVDVMDWYSNNGSITEVVFDDTFKDARPTSFYNWFYGLTNLIKITGIENLNTSEVTSMRGMFDKCKNLESVDLSHFNTDNLTNIRAMFCDCENLKTLDLGSFNTKNVTEAQYMFQNCKKLTTILIDENKWNLSKVTASNNHKGMFENCEEIIGNDGTTLGSKIDKTKAHANAGGYLTTGDYKIFYKWSDKSGYQAYTPSTFVESSSALTIPNPTREGYGFLYWTRVSADGTQIGESSTNLTIAAGEVGNRIYKMHWGVAYAVLSDNTEDDGKTLIFKCSETKPDGAYNLNSGEIVPGWEGEHSTITKVVFDESFQYARPTSFSRWFNDFENLETITGIQYLNTEEVTNMQLMFRNCKKLRAVDLSNFNTEKVTDMQFMFYDCESLTVLDITNFDTKRVENMKVMFTSCKNLQTILIGDKWDVANVTKSDRMFRYCSVLIGNDGAKVRGSVDATNAHAEAGGYLTKGDYKIFYKWADENSYKTQYTPSTYSGEIDVTINNPNDREYPFLYWTQISANNTQIGGTSATLTIPAGEVGNKIYVMHWALPPMYAVLSSDNKTLTFKSGEKPNGAYDLYDGETTNPGWYDNRKKITKVVFNASFAEARPTSCYCWFKEFENLEEIVGIENLNTSEVTTMRSMFDKCKKLENIDLSHFDTRNLKSMRSMFYDCIKLITLDLSSFNTDLVETMQYTFTNCSTLTCINIRNFNPENVENMSEMFSECKQLTTILVGQDWTQEDILETASSQNMFVNCNEIIGNDGTTFDASKVDKTNAHAGEGGYLTKDDYKIFYKWADDETSAYKTQYTPSTYNSSTTPLTIDNPNDREGYQFLHWTRVSASGTQIGSSSATLTIAESEGGNRIYKMHWTVKQYAINLPEGFKAYAEDDLDTPIESAPAGKKIIIKYEGTKPIKKVEVIKEE